MYPSCSTTTPTYDAFPAGVSLQEAFPAGVSLQEAFNRPSAIQHAPAAAAASIFPSPSDAQSSSFTNSFSPSLFGSNVSRASEMGPMSQVIVSRPCALPFLPGRSDEEDEEVGGLARMARLSSSTLGIPPLAFATNQQINEFNAYSSTPMFYPYQNNMFFNDYHLQVSSFVMSLNI